MESKTEIKKVNFFDEEFLIPRDNQAFKDAVAGAMSPAFNRKNDYAEKLKAFLLEKSGEQKAFLFNSPEEGFFWTIRTVRENSDKKEIIVLTKPLFDEIKSDFTSSINDVKYVNANHLGNFIAALSANTCAVMTELVDEAGNEIYSKDFISQISEICAVRDVAFIVDERRTFPVATGEVFAFSHYKILPDAVILGGTINRSFTIGAVLVAKKIKTVQTKKEIGFAVCSGALYAYEYVCSQGETVKSRAKKLSDLLGICKNVKTASVFGKFAAAEVQDAKKSAAELKERGVRVGVADEKLLFSITPRLSDDEFSFGLSVLSEVLKGAQNPFDMGKSY